MDALTLKSTVNELKALLSNRRIEKVYQPSSYELILRTSAGQLLLSAHPTHFTVHVTQLHFENPTTPTAYTMLMRKHLSKGYINNITMDGYERIVTLHISNTNEMFEQVSYKLIVELMGKHSNIILTDDNDKIIDSIKRIPISVSRVRQLLPGITYFPPPTKDDIPTELTEDYSSFTGINHVTRSALDDGNITINQCIDSITKPEPCLIYVNDKPKIPSSVNIPALKAQSFDSMCEMLDAFYSVKDSAVQSTDTVHAVNTILSRLNRSLDVHKKNLEANEEKYRLYGELITSTAYAIKQGQKSAEVLNYYTGETVEIPLKEDLSPHENAQHYYKRYSKLKAAKAHATEQINIIDEQKEYLENILMFLKNASSQKEVDAIKQELRDNGFLKKSKNKAKNVKLDPITYQSSDGFIIKVGRNSQQNDELTTKKSRPEDMWCHVKDIPGSHVIIQTQGKDISDTAIMEACTIAAFHSKGKTSSNVPVDYTLIKYVKKPAHALPGKVIYTHQNTLYVTPNPALISKLSK